MAVDTAFRSFSVALWLRGDVLEVREGEAFRHVERLNLRISDLLRRGGVGLKEVGALLVTVGPGYFTSLRVAASFVKAVHLVTGVPMYGFNTLQAMVVGMGDGKYVATMDARKGQVYAQSFRVEGGIPMEDGKVPLGIYDPHTLPMEGYTPLTSPEEHLRASNLFTLYFAGLGEPLSPKFSPKYIRPPDAVVNRGKTT